jgi:hypothetical protein
VCTVLTKLVQYQTHHTLSFNLKIILIRKRINALENHPDFAPNSVCLLSSNPKSHQPSIRWRSVLRFVFPATDIGLAGGAPKLDDSGVGGIGGGGGGGGGGS